MSIQVSATFTFTAWRFNTKNIIPQIFTWLSKKAGTLFKVGEYSLITFVQNSTFTAHEEIDEFKRRLPARDTENNKDTQFLLEQLTLQFVEPNGRRYSAQTIVIALNFFTHSRSCYKQVQKYLSLPHPNI